MCIFHLNILGKKIAMQCVCLKDERTDLLELNLIYCEETEYKYI